MSEKLCTLKKFGGGGITELVLGTLQCRRSQTNSSSGQMNWYMQGLPVENFNRFKCGTLSYSGTVSERYTKLYCYANSMSDTPTQINISSNSDIDISSYKYITIWLYGWCTSTECYVTLQNVRLTK